MLIDAIKDIKNIITASPNYSKASHKFDKTTYSLFSDFNESLVWEIDTPDNPLQPSNNFAWIEIDFTETIKVGELICTYTASTVPYVKYLYCQDFDGEIWNEFPYFSYQVVDADTLTQSEQEVVNHYAGYVFKKVRSNTPWVYTKDSRGVDSTSYAPTDAYVYIPYNPIGKTAISILPDEYVLLSPILDDMFTNFNRSIVDYKYEFTAVNISTNETSYIYDDLYIRQLRIEFKKFEVSPVPFKIDTLAMMTPVDIEVDVNVMSCFNNILFKPKYFEDNDFMPSLSLTFMEMLEFSDKNMSAKIPTLEIDFAIDNLSNKIFLYSNVELDLSRVFEPLYVWTIDAINRQGIHSFARYTYKTVSNRWTDVDSFLFNTITDTNNVLMDVSFSIVTNKLILTKKRIYDLTLPYLGDGWISSLGVGDMEINRTFFVY